MRCTYYSISERCINNDYLHAPAVSGDTGQVGRKKILKIILLYSLDSK